MKHDPDLTPCVQDMIHLSSWTLLRRLSWTNKNISSPSPLCMNKKWYFTVFINITSPTTNGIRGSTPMYISDLPLEPHDNINSCSNMLTRNSKSSMMICPQKNNSMSRKITKKDIYHTSSSGRASSKKKNWRPIFRTNSQHAMTAWPRKNWRPSIFWKITPRIQWWNNPHQKDCHFLKRATGTKKMNTLSSRYGKIRSATTAPRQVPHHPISETISKRLVMRSSMKKSREPAGQENPAGRTSNI